MPKMRGKRKDSQIEKLIEEATVDAYCDDEQATGFLTMIQDHLRCPAPARIVGEEVQVLEFDFRKGGSRIFAKCRRMGEVYWVEATCLEWPGKPPAGAEWIDAYRVWLVEA